VEKAEQQVKAIEDALAQAALQADGEQLTKLTVEYEQARQQVDTLLAEWERLAETIS